MTKTYLVSRHAGALAWLARQGVAAERVALLDANRIKPGDRVIGELIADVAGQVCARGGRYLHLTIDPAGNRHGESLLADDLEAFGARLEPLLVVPEAPVPHRSSAKGSTLITLLGAPRSGDYQTYAYEIDGGSWPSRWMPEALVAARRRTKAPINRLVIVGARGSGWDLLARIAGLDNTAVEFDLFASSGAGAASAAALAPLADALGRKLGVEATLLVAPYAEEAGSSTLAAALLARTLRPREKVILDVTFGLRDLMLTIFTTMLSLETLRDIELADVVYASIKTQQSDRATLVSTPGVRSIVEWVRALARLEATGDLRGIASLLREAGDIGDLLDRQEVDERLLRPRSAAARAKRLLDRVSRSQDPLAGLFGDALRERLSWATGSTRLSVIQASLARRAMADGDLARATALAFEACISAEMEERGLTEEEVENTTTRTHVQTALNNDIKQKPRPHRAASESDYLDLKGVRNALMHAGPPNKFATSYLTSPVTLAALIDRTICGWVAEGDEGAREQ